MVNRLKRIFKIGVFVFFLALSWIFQSAASAQVDLHNAAKQGNLKKIKKLLTQGTNINAVSSSGYTPLHISAGWDRRRVTEFLVSNGAEINVKNSSGLTPLHLAAKRGHLKMVGFLLSHGADPHMQDRSGRTRADLARDKSNDRIADLLEAMPVNNQVAEDSFFSSITKEGWYTITGGLGLLFLLPALFM